MRWPWQRRPPCPEAHRRAEEADQVARAQVKEAKARDAEARQLAARFRELRAQNHFAEGFARALREGH